MLPTIPAAVLLSAVALAACNPTYNWREVPAGPAAVRAMLPCKPDKAVRQVTMAGRQVELDGMGCDAGGATFAVFHADVGDAGRSGEALAQWKQATLANMKAATVQDRPFLPPGGLAVRESLQVVAAGRRPDGSSVESQAAYFARGSHVFQAVIYASKLRAEQTEPFFSGLRFQ